MTAEVARPFTFRGGDHEVDFQHMLQAEIIREPVPGRYYLDEDSVDAMQRQDLPPFAVLVALLATCVVGGVGAAIWLVILGDWLTLVYGILSLFFGYVLVLVRFVLGMVLFREAEFRERRDAATLHALYGLSDAVIIVAGIAAVMWLLLRRATLPSVIPLVLLSYAATVGPWTWVAYDTLRQAWPPREWPSIPEYLLLPIAYVAAATGYLTLGLPLHLAIFVLAGVILTFKLVPLTYHMVKVLQGPQPERESSAKVPLHPEYAGVTTHERLYHARLLGAFQQAARRGDREEITRILMQVDLAPEDASRCANLILAHPLKYGY